MSEPKLTPWYPASVKPVREGVYPTSIYYWRGEIEYGYSNWNGSRWSMQAATPHDAKARGFFLNAARQDKRWRGLAAPAEPKSC